LLGKPDEAGRHEDPDRADRAYAKAEHECQDSQDAAVPDCHQGAVKSQ
jgi:hypothetical protein